jgi:hypothetical protein
VADGCVALEAAKLEAAARALDPERAREAADEDAAPPAVAPMDPQQALHLLYMHRHYAPRAGRWPGRPPSRVTEAELNVALKRAMAALERREARKAGRL